jgi:prefoldin subunit 5
MDQTMPEQMIQLIRQINTLEREISLLKSEKLRLEKELNYFLVGDDGIQDSRESSRQIA